jgi:hypothetical protein
MLTAEKSVPGPNTSLKNPLDTLHRGPECKVSGFIFAVLKGTSIHECEHFMEVQGM